MFKTAATNSSVIFEELEQLFLTDTREGSVDELLLARAKRQAEGLMNANASEGHIALSAIAALKWDVAGAEMHVNAALRCDKSVAMLCNAVTTYEFLNRSDLACPHALAAGMAASSDGEVVELAITSLLSGGYVSDAVKVSRASEKIESSKSFSFNPVLLEEAINELGITEEYVQRVLNIARDVLTDQKRRSQELGIYTDRDPDGGMVVGYEVGFVGTIEDEFALEEKLSDGLGDLDGWNPTKLTVHLKYLSADDASKAG